MDKKRVLHVLTFLNQRGTTPTVLSVIKHDKEFEHFLAVKYVTSEEAKRNFEEYCTILTFPGQGPLSFDYPELPDKVKELGIDLVHVYLPGEELPEYVRKLNVPVILTVNCTKGCLFDKSGISKVVVPSNYSASLNPHLDPIVIPYGLDDSSSTADRRRLVKKYFGTIGGNTGEPIIISRVGSIETVKHVEDFFSVAYKFRHLRSVFFIIGGVDRSGYLEHLKIKYPSKGLATTGYLTEQEKADLYHCSDICLYPSEFEAFGFSILEPMVHGVPVISYNESAIPETVGPGGVCVDFDSVSQLCDVTAMFISRPALREKAGKAARKHWEDNFKATLYSQRIIDLYRETLNG